MMEKSLKVEEQEQTVSQQCILLRLKIRVISYIEAVIAFYELA